MQGHVDWRINLHRRTERCQGDEPVCMTTGGKFRTLATPCGLQYRAICTISAAAAAVYFGLTGSFNVSTLIATLKHSKLLGEVNLQVTKKKCKRVH